MTKRHFQSVATCDQSTPSAAPGSQGCGLIDAMATIVGYARISTGNQRLDMQLDALTASGCTRIHTDTASGALAARPGLDQALAELDEGDTPRRMAPRPPRTLPLASRGHHRQPHPPRHQPPQPPRSHRHHHPHRPTHGPPHRLTRRIRARTHHRTNHRRPRSRQSPRSQPRQPHRMGTTTRRSR